MNHMTFWHAILVVTVPLFVLLVPGILMVAHRDKNAILIQGARALAWSMILSMLGGFILSFFGYSVMLLLPIGLALSVLSYSLRPKPHPWILLAILLPVVFVYALFSVPFLLIHDGLPTGDSQKAIFWAQRVIDTNALPDYSLASEYMNRDPVDFFTPALHAGTAYVMALSPDSLISIGFFAILISIAIAWIGAALTKELFGHHPHIVPPAIAAILILTNLRFLRYLREPGYHYQNIVGEFFLFCLLLFSIRLIKKWNWTDAALASGSALSLLLSHQFSSFIAFFMMMPVIMAMLVRYRLHIRNYIWHHAAAAGAISVVSIAAGIVGVGLGLYEKLPHFFTTAPHLLSLTLSFTEYPSMMGAAWLFTGLAGLGLMALQAKKHEAHFAAVWAFVLATVVLLLLSQGPRLFINIPPVRALFYSVVPLSVAGAYLIAKLAMHIRHTTRGFPRAVLISGTAAFVAAFSYGSLAQAYQTLSHTVRTNATLTSQQLHLAKSIQNAATAPHEAVLIDDHNRRSSSWLLLSGQPMFTRIAADLERQMDESSQSTARHDLYLRQLDYEKIFAFGSRPETVHLLKKHNIRWLTGIEKSTDSALARSTVLQPAFYGGDIIIYELTGEHSCPIEGRCLWLLRPTTLVNDIGNRQDTFEHLPVSIRSPRLSDPQFDGQHTYRSTTSPYIPLRFNIGQYVRALWDKEHTGRPDTAVELLVEFVAAPPGLTIQTPAGTTYPISDRNNMIRIPAKDVPFDDKGFITITINNPDEETVSISFIALGLARVP